MQQEGRQNTLTLAIAGCGGRMGLALVKAALATPGVRLTAGSERPGFDPAKLKDALTLAGCPHIEVTDDAEAVVARSDAVIDFTAPAASLAIAHAAAAQGKIHIIGTTGFTPEEQTRIEACAQRASIVQSGNFSLGVNVLEGLVAQAARILSPDYDIEICEMHHKHKKDAPSGTALMLGLAAARGRGAPLAEHYVGAREGVTGERKTGDIGFAVMRGGDVVGEHSVTFAGQGEMIVLSHRAFNRDIFARGAIHAALWASDKPAGLYSMQDVLFGR